MKLRLPQHSPGALSLARTGGRLTGRPAVPTHPVTHPSTPASEAGTIGPRRRSSAPEAAKGSYPPHPHPAPPGRGSSLPGPGQLLAGAGPAPYFSPHRRLRRRRRRRRWWQRPLSIVAGAALQPPRPPPFPRRLPRSRHPQPSATVRALRSGGAARGRVATALRRRCGGCPPSGLLKLRLPQHSPGAPSLLARTGGRFTGRPAVLHWPPSDRIRARAPSRPPPGPPGLSFGWSRALARSRSGRGRVRVGSVRVAVFQSVGRPLGPRRLAGLSETAGRHKGAATKRTGQVRRAPDSIAIAASPGLSGCLHVARSRKGARAPRIATGGCRPRPGDRKAGTGTGDERP